MSRSRDIANLLGSSSPIVDKTIIDAKGDLLIGSADNTVTKLAAGSTGQLPLVDSSTSSGLRYVDPLTNRNFIINGAMNVHQRGTSSTGITASGYYTADRWNLVPSSLGTWTNTLETDAPTGSGFVKSFKILCTTADATPAAGDLLIVQHGGIEGQNLQRVKKGTASAEQLTLSFWVKSNVTGTYVANLIDNDNSRSVSISYAISASATWERKTITFPADITGAFDNDNGNSLGVQFWLGAGSNFTSGTLNTTWDSATSANRAVGQTNLAAATNNYWQVTGVQLETGPVATPFEFEPYEATLRKCQRYYWRNSASGVYTALSGYGNAFNTTTARPHASFPVSMRVAPTSVEYKNLAAYDGVNLLAVSSASLSQPSSNGSQVDLSVTGATQYRAYIAVSNNTTDSYLAFSAEL